MCTHMCDSACIYTSNNNNNNNNNNSNSRRENRKFKENSSKSTCVMQSCDPIYL